ncbi:hypothetical protein TNCV_2630801 [Trichonephila clavipes]|nr:hypothetical protein TNCV_2630801 [Trichonephila clavipes]
MWALSNPHITRPRALHQQCFTVNVRAGITDDSLTGPYILPPRLDSDKYVIILQEVLPMSSRLFHATCGFSRTWYHSWWKCLRDYFYQTFPNRWVVRGGPIA